MKKICIMFIIMSGIILSKDIKLPKYLYIAQIYQYNDSWQNDFRAVAIIKIEKKRNILYESKIKSEDDSSRIFPMTEQGKLILKEIDELLNIDFSKCKLEKLNNLNVGSRYPLMLKEIIGYDNESSRILAIVTKEDYEKGSGVFRFENYVKAELYYKDYFCPEYYNGE